MAIWIALLRGINVGGNNPLPMKALRKELTDAGLVDVATYIQSGNVVFRSPARSASKLTELIRGTIETHHGFSPAVMALTSRELSTIIKNNPFPQAESAPKSVHVYMLGARAPQANLQAAAELCTATERIVADANVIYLHAPDGIGRSKLASRLESTLGVTATGRNWNTVTKLDAMTAELDAG